MKQEIKNLALNSPDFIDDIEKLVIEEREKAANETALSWAKVWFITVLILVCYIIQIKS